MNGEQVAVVFDNICKSTQEAEEVKSVEATGKHSVCWLHGMLYPLDITLGSF